MKQAIQIHDSGDGTFADRAAALDALICSILITMDSWAVASLCRETEEGDCLKAPTCKECHGLWLEYARVTTEHFRLDGKLRVAALSHDHHEAIQALTREVENAKAVKESVRETIRKHEESHIADDAAD